MSDYLAGTLIVIGAFVACLLGYLFWRWMLREEPKREEDKRIEEVFMLVMLFLAACLVAALCGISPLDMRAFR